MSRLVDFLATWDSGWVQAVGSIVAIIGGFLYVAVQHQLDLARERRSQREMRTYTALLAEEVVSNFQQILATFEECEAASIAVRANGGDRITEQRAGEFLALTPNECGSADFTHVARRVGVFGLIFSEAAKEGASEARVRPDCIARMKLALSVIEPAAEHLRKNVAP